MDDATENGGMEITTEHLVAWYKTDAGVPVGENRPVQKVVVAVTHMRYVKQNFGDRAALIVTTHDSGDVLFDRIIEKEWTLYKNPELQDPSGRVRCCIVIVEEHGTEEGFGDVCYDSHDFLFDHDEEYARFLKLMHGGQELAGLYHQNLRKVLITGVLVRGEHRPAIAA
ncbi:hypothetical protein OH76DRAFT_1481315 [Lentinus brumalis]|uniref:Uncharacterized protein n=1 Tax=Lentinus brumalis TaxID=2498619 RepID=A0A371DH24_9APHY|nr:hypothetical protein OH76DRAFT_1481315 [Polyporus brumalis]